MNKVIIDDVEYKLVSIESEETELYQRKEDASMTDEDLKYRIEEEGIGYTLEHYCSYSDIKQEKTRVLFGQAKKAIDRLKQHIGCD